MQSVVTAGPGGVVLKSSIVDTLANVVEDALKDAVVWACVVLAVILPGIGGGFVVVGATSKAAMTTISAAETGIRGVAKYQIAAFHATGVTIATMMTLCHDTYYQAVQEYCISE